MKKILILILILAPAFAFAQTKGTGWWYFTATPNTNADTLGTELAYSIGEKALYYWDRDSTAWIEYVSGLELEGVQDAVGAMFTGGTQTNVSISYDDGLGVMNVTGRDGIKDATTGLPGVDVTIDADTNTLLIENLQGQRYSLGRLDSAYTFQFDAGFGFSNIYDSGGNDVYNAIGLIDYAPANYPIVSSYSNGSGTHFITTPTFGGLYNSANLSQNLIDIGTSTGDVRLYGLSGGVKIRTYSGGDVSIRPDGVLKLYNIYDLPDATPSTNDLLTWPGPTVPAFTAPAELVITNPFGGGNTLGAFADSTFANSGGGGADTNLFADSGTITAGETRTITAPGDSTRLVINLTDPTNGGEAVGVTVEQTDVVDEFRETIPFKFKYQNDSLQWNLNDGDLYLENTFNNFRFRSADIQIGGGTSPNGITGDETVSIGGNWISPDSTASEEGLTGSTYVTSHDETGTFVDWVDVATLGAGGGETNTASNLASPGLFSSKNGVDLEFLGIAGGGGNSIGTDATTLTVTHSINGLVNNDGIDGENEIMYNFTGFNRKTKLKNALGIDTFEIVGDELRLSLLNDGDAIYTADLKLDAGVVSITPTDSVTIDINFDSHRAGRYQVNMSTAATSTTVTLNAPTNPVSGNGVYTFHFQNTASNEVDFPTNFLDETGTAWDASTTYSMTADFFMTCYYDGTNYYCK